MVVGQGLRIGHIERSPRNVALPQRPDQRIGVDVSAAGHVDEPGCLLHESELLRPDDPPGLGGQRQSQHDDQCVAQRAVEL